MFVSAPISPRITAIKEKCREHDYGHVILDSERTKIYTDYYKTHEAQPEQLKRAGALIEWAKNRTLCFEDDAMFVGNIGREWRAACNYVEWGTAWLDAVVNQPDEDFKADCQTPGCFHYISDEDRANYREAVEYWRDRSFHSRVLAALPEDMWAIKGDNCTTFGNRTMDHTANMPQGHFCANYQKVVDKGWKYIAEEAQAHMDAISGKVFGTDAAKHVTWRSIKMVAEAAMIITRRYADMVKEYAAKEERPERKAELEMMAEGLEWIIENPAKTFWQSMEMVVIYQLMLHADGQAHGVTLGRLDQYCGHFMDEEIAAGTLTQERAQELTDAFILKLGDYFVQFYGAARGQKPPVTQDKKDRHHFECGGHHFTVGGVKKNGEDATNGMTITLLQTYQRLYLTIPSCSVRIHKDTPWEVWEAAIESSKAAGGMPTFENDGCIVGALIERGLSQEDANNYCIIGCVEPAGCGCEWAACGSSGGESFSNLVGIMNMAIHNGKNIKTGCDAGLKTGYLYDYKTFDEFKEAFMAQMHYFLNWHISFVNFYELQYSTYFPSVVASATMEGCMDKGMDVLKGGSKYNSTGFTALGIGNVADSLYCIKKLVFDDKMVTARELYDALVNDWKGHEELQRYICNVMPHYGNSIDEVDQLGVWALTEYAKHMNNAVGPRGKWRGGTFTVTTHLEFGAMTSATPDGRNDGAPLAEAISPRQGFDRNGPTAYLLSASKLPHDILGNGDMLNIRFSPSAMNGENGNKILHDMLATYFDEGGMQVQFNVVSTETLRDAQVNPDDHEDLIVRIAGFSVYFVEVNKALQEDFITRTEHNV